MTTTHDVPMPIPAARRSVTSDERILCEPVYTADQVRDTAIKYADARCAKLQEELAATEERSIRWSLTAQRLQAERDALAEKVKAMEDNDRRYRWLRTFPNNVRPYVYAPCGLLMREEHLDAAIDAAGGDHADA